MITCLESLSVTVLTLVTVFFSYLALCKSKLGEYNEFGIKVFGFLTAVFGIWDLVLMIKLLIK